MDSQVTRTLKRIVAKRRFRVAMSALERVEVLWVSFWRMQEKISA
jgi:hypothetical protein